MLTKEQELNYKLKRNGMLESFKLISEKILAGMSVSKKEAAIYLQKSLSTINRDIKNGNISPIIKRPGKNSHVEIPAQSIVRFTKQIMIS
jgi:hypothetical protein